MTAEQARKRIEVLGIRKSHAAKVCGVSPSRLSQYLNGGSTLNNDAYTRLKNYLGL